MVTIQTDTFTPLRVGLMPFSCGSILSSMPVKPFSRILALLRAAAYIGATMLVIAPNGNDMSSAAIDGMTHEQGARATGCLAMAWCPAASPILAAFFL